jgi:hypothetical protein
MQKNVMCLPPMCLTHAQQEASARSHLQPTRREAFKSYTFEQSPQLEMCIAFIHRDLGLPKAFG